MAKPGSNEQCSPVDPNYSDAKPSDDQYLGAKSPMDHPSTKSTVDPNYGFSGGGTEGAGPKPRKSFAKEESDEFAGVNGAGGKYTDDDKDGGD